MLANLANRATRSLGLNKKGGAGTFVSFTSGVPYRSNWFQLGLDMGGDSALRTNVVYACVSVIAQEIARMQAHVWTRDPKTGLRTRTRPDLDRLLRKPNQYQSHSDFWLAVVWSLLGRGNAYVFREMAGGEDVAWHPLPPGSCQPRVTDRFEVFYEVGACPMAPALGDRLYPARYVLHLRLFCPRHPLIGETPISAAAMSVAQGVAITQSSARFFANMSRPGGILTAPPDLKLTEEAAERVKASFESATAGGQPVVAANGYEWKPLTLSAADTQMIEQYRLTVEDIARVFRMPLHMLGDLSKATFNNVDAIQRSFIVQTLGFYIEHIEAALACWQDLDPDTYVEFDVEGAMMRPDFKSRMEAFAKAVQGGVYTPNEVRAEEHLPKVEGGDTLYLQAQMTPVETLAKQDLPNKAAAADAKLVEEAMLRRAARIK